MLILDLPIAPRPVHGPGREARSDRFSFPNVQFTLLEGHFGWWLWGGATLGLDVESAAKDHSSPREIV